MAYELWILWNYHYYNQIKNLRTNFYQKKYYFFLLIFLEGLLEKMEPNSDYEGPRLEVILRDQEIN